MVYTKYIPKKGEITMTTTIQKWGNSQGVRLPKYILEAVNLRENESIDIITDKEKIIIKKAAKRRKTIKELFANYHEEYQPIEIDWGKPEGREIW